SARRLPAASTNPDLPNFCKTKNDRPPGRGTHPARPGSQGTFPGYSVTSPPPLSVPPLSGGVGGVGLTRPVRSTSSPAFGLPGGRSGIVNDTTSASDFWPSGPT